MEFLKENPKTHISEIAEKVNMDRSTVAYHLGLLEKLDLVKSEYVILKEPSSMGKAGRIYRVNEEEIRNISEAITKHLSDLSEEDNSVFCKPKEKP